MDEYEKWVINYENREKLRKRYEEVKSISSSS